MLRYVPLLCSGVLSTKAVLVSMRPEKVPIVERQEILARHLYAWVSLNGWMALGRSDKVSAQGFAQLWANGEGLSLTGNERSSNTGKVNALYRMLLNAPGRTKWLEKKRIKKQNLGGLWDGVCPVPKVPLTSICGNSWEDGYRPESGYKGKEEAEQLQSYCVSQMLKEQGHGTEWVWGRWHRVPKEGIHLWCVSVRSMPWGTWTFLTSAVAVAQPPVWGVEAGVE